MQNNYTVDIELMTTEEHGNGGKNLTINYTFATTPPGKIFIATTTKGICSLQFVDNDNEAVNSLRNTFPNADIHQKKDSIQQNALAIFATTPDKRTKKIKLHIKATPFQYRVWQHLTTLPYGSLTTYGRIAAEIHKPNAFRAVGNAVSANPVAILIPCHRVLPSTGRLGNYRWGAKRKAELIKLEAESK